MNDQDYICDGCKRAINQIMPSKVSRAVNCLAHGCSRYDNKPCTAYDIFRYSYDRLIEEGFINDSNS